MTIASDQGGGTEKLSATSEKILELREEVFAEWEKSVRGAVAQASALRQPILIDTLPTFYDNLAQSVTPAYPRLEAVSASTIATEHGGERVMLSVHNEGTPIAAEEIEDIFQFYQRARAAAQGKKEGWGIGLSFVRAVAESHGGSVTVDSSLERGTTFLMDMPADARPFQDAPTLA